MCQKLDPDARIQQSRFSEWERGEGRPELRQLLVICAALGLSRAETARAREVWEAAELANMPTLPGGT
jgi:hypothetical protein